MIINLGLVAVISAGRREAGTLEISFGTTCKASPGDMPLSLQLRGAEAIEFLRSAAKAGLATDQLQGALKQPLSGVDLNIRHMAEERQRLSGRYS